MASLADPSISALDHAALAQDHDASAGPSRNHKGLSGRGESHGLSVGPWYPPAPSLAALPVDTSKTEPKPAYYKLQFGDDVTGFSYYVRTLAVVIGRTCEKGQLEDLAESSPPVKAELGVEDLVLAQGSIPRDLDEKVEPEQLAIDLSTSKSEDHPAGDAAQTSPLVADESEHSGLAEDKAAVVEAPERQEISEIPIDAQDATMTEEIKPSIEEIAPGSSGIVESQETSDPTKPGAGSPPPPPPPPPPKSNAPLDHVDVDLGPLKSVSRNHAKIGYWAGLGCFCLEILGRNGAWVDDRYYVKGSTVPLGQGSQIQIATRIFSFILPPSALSSPTYSQYGFENSPQDTDHPLEDVPYPYNLPPSQVGFAEFYGEPGPGPSSAAHMASRVPPAFNAFAAADGYGLGIDGVGEEAWDDEWDSDSKDSWDDESSNGSNEDEDDSEEDEDEDEDDDEEDDEDDEDDDEEADEGEIEVEEETPRKKGGMRKPKDPISKSRKKGGKEIEEDEDSSVEDVKPPKGSRGKKQAKGKVKGKDDGESEASSSKPSTSFKIKLVTGKGKGGKGIQPAKAGKKPKKTTAVPEPGDEKSTPADTPEPANGAAAASSKGAVSAKRPVTNGPVAASATASPSASDADAATTSLEPMKPFFLTELIETPGRPGHIIVNVPIPPSGSGPRPPPGPLIGLDGDPFIGPPPLKPTATFATIIHRALMYLPRGRGTLGEVCNWVAGEWEWFRLNVDGGWQNSIRHNLSLNKAFLKVPRIPEDDPESKGSVWIIDPEEGPLFEEKQRKDAMKNVGKDKNPDVKREKDRIKTEERARKQRDYAIEQTQARMAAQKAALAQQRANAAANGHPSASTTSTQPNGGTAPAQRPANPVANANGKPANTATLPQRAIARPQGANSVNGKAQLGPKTKITVSIQHLTPALRAKSIINTTDSAGNPLPFACDGTTLILDQGTFGHLTSDIISKLTILGASGAVDVLSGWVINRNKNQAARAAAAAQNQASKVSTAGKPGVGKTGQSTNGQRPTTVTTKAGAKVDGKSVLKTGATGKALPGPAPPGASLTKVISMIAEVANAKGDINTVGPNASALLRYIRVVGVDIDLKVAEKIWATGEVPPLPVKPAAGGAAKPATTVATAATPGKVNGSETKVEVTPATKAEVGSGVGEKRKAEDEVPGIAEETKKPKVEA